MNQLSVFVSNKGEREIFRKPNKRSYLSGYNSVGFSSPWLPLCFMTISLWHMTSQSFLRVEVVSSYVSIQGPWKFMVTSQILTHLDCWLKANNFWGQWGKTTRLSCCILKSSPRSKWILAFEQQPVSAAPDKNAPGERCLITMAVTTRVWKAAMPTETQAATFSWKQQ